MNVFQTFTTEPHGEQALTQVELEDNGPLRNRLFELRDMEGNSVVMTGEELTSLATQWLARAANAA